MLAMLALIGTADAADVFAGSTAELTTQIGSAPSGSRILLLPGTYATNDIDINGKNLIIQALVPGSVTFTRSASTRMFRVRGTTTLTMRDVTIDAGQEEAFGTENSASLTLERVWLQNGRGTSTARAAYVRQASTGTLTVLDSYLGPTGTASGAGGQIQATNGNVIIDGSMLEGGEATTTGGCVSTTANDLTITDSYFVGCDGATGGALYIGDISNTALVDWSVFESNVSGTHGGAIHSIDPLDVSHSVFCLNTSSTASAGGIYWGASQNETLDVVHSVFLNNGSDHGSFGGSAIRADGSGNNRDVTVTYSSFTNNDAAGAYDGFFDMSTSSTSVVWSNNQHLWARYSTNDRNVVEQGSGTSVTASGNNGYPRTFAATGFTPSGSTSTNPGISQPATNACDYEDLDTTGPKGAFGTSGLLDGDGDGWLRPFDCNDGNNAIHPAAVEVCDGIDNDCDFMIDEGLATSDYYLDANDDGVPDTPNVVVQSCQPIKYLTDNCSSPPTTYTDSDGDGYGDPSTATTQCPAPPGNVADGTDCDDTDSGVNPGEAEICDGIDNDCVGGADDELPFVTYGRDNDSDTFGDPTFTQATCDGAPAGYVADVSDCDDGAAAVHPGVVEVCDGVDNDCVGGIDDGLTFVTYGRDGDTDGYGDSGDTRSTCDGAPAGYVADVSDCDDGAAAVHPGVAEVCDGIDNDCVGGIDDGLAFTTWYLDADGDGYGRGGNPISTCDAAAPTGYAALAGDCNDGTALRFPGNPEVCDGIDNDCVGGSDNGLTFVTYYQDQDGDGYGLTTSTVSTCDGLPTGYATVGGDCADTGPDAAARFPNNPEVCDGIDNNCAGGVDNGLTFVTYYQDQDGDGYGVNGSTVSTCDGLPTGYATVGGDCADTGPDAAVRFPNNPEVCDGIDNNCAGGVDNGLTFVTYYQDQDGDGYGVNGSTVSTCDGLPTGYATVGGDCADTGVNGPRRFPGNTEICDGIDNDCANGADDGLTFVVYGLDLDGDGFGDPNVTSTTCDGAPTDYVDDLTDCDDTGPDAAARFPGNPEICNGIDNDCVDGPDSGLTFLSYNQDLDGDGWGNENISLSTCDGPPTGYVGTVGDCADDPTNQPLAAFIYPVAVEYCDGVDNDCNGMLDTDDPNAVAGLWYPDLDGDGFGDDGAVPDETCTPQTGWVSNGYDCDDANAGVQPLATDAICNGIDDNCDGQTDEEAPFTEVFRDADMDGFGGTSLADLISVQCPGDDTSDVSGDCDDQDPDIHPGQVDDDCDGVDQDCDGTADDGAPFVDVPQDVDGDGFAGDTTASEQCPEAIPDVEDCDDDDPGVNPDATEDCDDVDRDCDGVAGRDQRDDCGGGSVTPPPEPTGCGCTNSAAPASIGLIGGLLGLLGLRRRA